MINIRTGCLQTRTKKPCYSSFPEKKQTIVIGRHGLITLKTNGTKYFQMMSIVANIISDLLWNFNLQQIKQNFKCIKIKKFQTRKGLSEGKMNKIGNCNIKKRSTILHITFIVIVTIGRIIQLFVRIFESNAICTTNAFIYFVHCKSYLLNLHLFLMLFLQIPGP